MTRLIFAQLNTNSLRKSFDSLLHIITKNIDVMMVFETKIDSSFPSAQFHLGGYATPLNGGGIFLHLKEDILST